MNRFTASLMVSFLLNSCHYDTPSSYSLPVTQGPSGAIQENSNARPTVRFPARVAVVRIEGSHGGFRMIPETDVEQDEHAAVAAALPGVAGIVSLNRVALVSQVKTLQRDRALEGAGEEGGARQADGEAAGVLGGGAAEGAVKSGGWKPPDHRYDACKATLRSGGAPLGWFTRVRRRWDRPGRSRRV